MNIPSVVVIIMIHACFNLPIRLLYQPGFSSVIRPIFGCFPESAPLFVPGLFQCPYSQSELMLKNAVSEN